LRELPDAPVDDGAGFRQIPGMDRQTIIRRLKDNQRHLEALGLRRVSVFGSTARGEAREDSDVDLAVMLDEGAGIDLFRFAAISEQVSRMLDMPVDMVIEPARNARMQALIERDRVRVF
jgi:predicted nucleotidyltransferase